ncbi:MAG: YigZ family protein [Gammaproteobacteria bacterium]|nr:YigZ family protein [Gammaproteobacteria bacterium]
MSSYRIPATALRHEVVIERSRFIADLAHAPDPAAAKAFVQRIREEFPDATHHCFAFVAGRPNDSQCMGSSDDGEPGGTAGKPMLTVLAHSGVGEIVAVVTRYYGGIKLGTGGLARAYGGTVAQGLNALALAEKVDYARLQGACDYGFLATVEHSLAECEGRIAHADYSHEVVLRLEVPETRLAEFLGLVRNRSQDRVQFRKEED